LLTAKSTAALRGIKAAVPLFVMKKP